MREEKRQRECFPSAFWLNLFFLFEAITLGTCLFLNTVVLPSGLLPLTEHFLCPCLHYFVLAVCTHSWQTKSSVCCQSGITQISSQVVDRVNSGDSDICFYTYSSSGHVWISSEYTCMCRQGLRLNLLHLEHCQTPYYDDVVQISIIIIIIIIITLFCKAPFTKPKVASQ